MVRSLVFATLVTVAIAIDCGSRQFQKGSCQFQDQAGVYTCPQGCSCFYRPANRSNLIDCRHAGLTQAPEAIPIYAEAVYNELTLEGNQLERFRAGSGEGYGRLTHLRLANNKIKEFDPEGLPRDLQLIDLSHNQLDRLSDDTFCFLMSGTELESIFLSDNPFLCDCPAFSLALLLRGGFEQIKDGDKVLCPDGKQVNKLEARNICVKGVPPQGKPCYDEGPGHHVYSGRQHKDRK